MLGKKKAVVQETTVEAAPPPPAEAERMLPEQINPGARAEPRSTVVPDYGQQEEPSDLTQIIAAAHDGARLRFIGRAALPEGIDIQIAVGEVFSIGRFDASVGKQQSSFEFDKKTKAVSRRHAVVERGADGYTIVDLASSAGTFINGQKLPPNTPCEVKRGCYVSFGNSGADYIWEG